MELLFSWASIVLFLSFAKILGLFSMMYCTRSHRVNKTTRKKFNSGSIKWNRLSLPTSWTKYEWCIILYHSTPAEEENRSFSRVTFSVFMAVVIFDWFFFSLNAWSDLYNISVGPTSKLQQKKYEQTHTKSMLCSTNDMFFFVVTKRFCWVHALRLTRLGIKYINRSRERVSKRQRWSKKKPITKNIYDLNNSPVNHRRYRMLVYVWFPFTRRIEIYFISYLFSNQRDAKIKQQKRHNKPRIKASCIMFIDEQHHGPIA